MSVLCIFAHMKTEMDKMQSGELYNIEDPEVQQSLTHAKIVLQKFNQLTLFRLNIERR